MEDSIIQMKSVTTEGLRQSHKASESQTVLPLPFPASKNREATCPVLP